MRSGSRTSWGPAAAGSNLRQVSQCARAVVIGCALALALTAPAHADKSRPPKNPGLDRLWSEYPLNPVTTNARPSTPAPQPNPAPEPKRRPVAPPAAQPTGGGGSSTTTFVVLGLVVALAAAAVALVVSARRRGGVMARIVSRLLPKPGQGTAAGHEPQANDTTIDRLQSYHVERSTKMGAEQHDERPTGRPAAPERESAGFGDIGDRVSAILHSAQAAADDIREKADLQATRIREAAEKDAAAKAQEAERQLQEQRSAIEHLRPEAERYSHDVRKAADEYAAAKRREAEEHAEKVREQAEATAKHIEEEAVQHRKRLEEESRALESWLEQAATAFKNVTGRLENLSKAKPSADAADEGPAEGEDRTLADALKARTEYAKTE